MPKINGRYFNDPIEVMPHFGVFMDLEAGIALRLIEHFAVVAAKIDGEDKAGRSKLELLSPQELVDRAFDISKAFVERTENEGRIIEAEPADKRAVLAGQLERLKHEHSYLGSDDDPPMSIQDLRSRAARRAKEREERESAKASK